MVVIVRNTISYSMYKYSLREVSIRSVTHYQKRDAGPDGFVLIYNNSNIYIRPNCPGGGGQFFSPEDIITFLSADETSERVWSAYKV